MNPKREGLGFLTCLRTDINDVIEFGIPFYRTPLCEGFRELGPVHATPLIDSHEQQEAEAKLRDPQIVPVYLHEVFVQIVRPLFISVNAPNEIAPHCVGHQSTLSFLYYRVLTCLPLSMYHIYVSYLCIISMYHIYASYLCIISMYIIWKLTN